MERGRKMDLVFISVYAEAYYSTTEYYDSFWIKRSSYEKIKNDLSDELYCGELDGKHSETIGRINVCEDACTEEEYATEAHEAEQDGYRLEAYLKDLYSNVNIDFKQEQQEINKFFENIDADEKVILRVPRSKVNDLVEYADNLKKMRGK